VVSFRCSGVSLSFAITDPHPCVFVPHPCGPVSFSCLSRRKKPKRRTPPQHRLPRFLRGRCVNVGRGSPTMHPASRRTRARPARAPAGLVVRRPPALKGTRRATSSALLRAEPEPRCRSGVSRDRHTTTMLESIAAEAAPTRSSPPPLWERLQPRCFGFCFCAQERAALPSGSPCGTASGWRRCARVRCGPWMDRQRTP